jgi:hypothetical protein
MSVGWDAGRTVSETLTKPPSRTDDDVINFAVIGEVQEP